MNPIGKYFRAKRDYYYCYEESRIFPTGYTCLWVGDGFIRQAHFDSMDGMPRSTRKAFMKAYAKTIDKMDSLTGVI